MFKVLTVFGTRPEVIKMAPVIRELRKYPKEVNCRTCITGQHRHMIDPLLKLFEIVPNYDLHIMEEKQSLEHITISVLKKVGEIIDQEKPKYLIVQGDTTTAMAASLAGFYKKVKIVHIEAGLRTWDKWQPYPEETNRRIIDSVSDLYFVHTETAKKNLLDEGVIEERIEVTGNTVIDALLDAAAREYDATGTALERIFSNGKKIILITAHRRENLIGPLVNICKAIKEIALRLPSEVCFVYPVHLNPVVRATVHLILQQCENVFLLEPLEYFSFVHLMKRSFLILTDSGGIQEEAPSLGKPVLILRKVTERPEVVKAGAAEIVGTDEEKIIGKTMELLNNSDKYHKMAMVENPYGDGKASIRLISRILKDGLL